MIPIYEIIDFTGNRYLFSRAAMKRAREINFIGDEELEAFDGKIVSLALTQILRGDIHYTLIDSGKDKGKKEDSKT
jgi:DNA-directed RNA polymerase subunit K/omega